MKTLRSTAYKASPFRLFLLFIVFFLASAVPVAIAQVTSVQYLIEYNESSSLYDCKIHIESGSAETYPQRIQFNSQYTVVVPTGADCILTEFHNPTTENQNYTGTQPLIWEEYAKVLSPVVQPVNDFYAFVPDLDPTASYNNLYAGDTITLFSLQINVDPCENTVRPFQNNIDLFNDGFITGGGDYSNGFTLGGYSQLYSGNVDTPYGILNLLDPIEMCIGSTSSFFPLSNGTWQSENPEVISINENTGTLTALSSGSSIITYIDNQTSCISEFEATVFPKVDVQFEGENTVCIGHFTSVSPPGTWISADPSIATVDIQGNVQGHSEGTTSLIYNDAQSGCISTPLQVNIVSENDPSCVVSATEIDLPYIKIYPNPVQHTLYVDLEKSIESLSLYSMNSQLLKHIKPSENQKNGVFPIDEFQPGVYLLGIQSNGKIHYQKIFIAN